MPAACRTSPTSSPGTAIRSPPAGRRWPRARPILVDARMVAAGVMPRRLPAGNVVLARSTTSGRRPGRRPRARPARRPRSSSGAPHLDGAVVAIGNAPTALFHLLDRLRDWPERPARDPGLPGGLRRRGREQGGADRGRPRRALGHLARPPGRQRHGRGRGQRAPGPTPSIEPWLTRRRHRRGRAGRARRRARAAHRRGRDPGRRRAASGDAARRRTPSGWPGARRWPTRWPSCWRCAAAPVAVLATGDPLWYGVGRCCCATSRREVTILPHVSAFQEACSRLGWPLEEVRRVSAARPPARRAAPPLPARPAAAGADRRRRGPGRIGALPGRGRLRRQPDLGARGAGRRRASAWSTARPPSLAEAPLRRPQPAWRSSSSPTRAGGPAGVPGLPDDAFDHDGQLTKAEVRAVTLAALAPLRRRAAVGRRRRRRQRRHRVAARGPRHAGRSRSSATPTGRARIAANAERWACPSSVVRSGEAPDGAGRPAGARRGLRRRRQRPRRACSTAAGNGCAPGGRLVANAVTLAGEAALLAFHAAHGGRLLRLGARPRRAGRRPAGLAAGHAGDPAGGDKAMRRGKLDRPRASARATPSC